MPHHRIGIFPTATNTALCFLSFSFAFLASIIVNSSKDGLSPLYPSYSYQSHAQILKHNHPFPFLSPSPFQQDNIPNAVPENHSAPSLPSLSTPDRLSHDFPFPRMKTLSPRLRKNRDVKLIKVFCYLETPFVFLLLTLLRVSKQVFEQPKWMSILACSRLSL